MSMAINLNLFRQIQGKPMKAIAENPFRLLGLSIMASDRDIAKRMSDLKAYASVGRQMEFPNDFTVFSTIERNSENINEAMRKIEFPEGRLFQSLFWFWEKNDIDALVLERLAEGDVDKAISLWKKAIQGGPVTQRNISHIKNLGLLYLALAGDKKNPDGIDWEYLEEGLQHTGRVFFSPEFSAYSRSVAGKGGRNWISLIGKQFAREIIGTILVKDSELAGSEIKKIIQAFSTFPSEIQDDVVSPFKEKYFQQIKKEIDAIRAKYGETPVRGCLAGNKLHLNTRSLVALLKEFLPSNDIQLKIESDKIASEIRRYVQVYWSERGHNVGKTAIKNILKALRGAKSLSTQQLTNVKIEEMISFMKEYQDELNAEESSFDFHEENRSPVECTIQQSNNAPQSACYIATMAYEDINAPEVQRFREFRDDVLMKRSWGRVFTRIYYSMSPFLVRVLGRSRIVKRSSRSALDLLLKGLRR